MRRDIEHLLIESRFLAQQSSQLQDRSRAASLRLTRLIYDSQRLCRWPPIFDAADVPEIATLDNYWIDN